MKILAVDPGGTTGLARYDSDVKHGAEGSFTSFEQSTLPALEFIHGYLRGYSLSRPDLIVCESFLITAGTHKLTRAGVMAAIESIGTIRYLCHFHSVRFEAQTPEMRKWATNARLKKLGWRNPSEGGHRDDAARHLLVAAIRHELIDPALFLQKEKA